MNYRYIPIYINGKKFYKVANPKNWNILWFSDSKWWVAKWENTNDVKKYLSSNTSSSSNTSNTNSLNNSSGWLDESEFWSSSSSSSSNTSSNTSSSPDWSIKWKLNDFAKENPYLSAEEIVNKIKNQVGYNSKDDEVYNNFYSYYTPKTKEENSTSNNSNNNSNSSSSNNSNTSTTNSTQNNSSNIVENSEKITDYIKNPKTWEIRLALT